MEKIIVIGIVLVAAIYLITKYRKNYIRAKDGSGGCSSCDCKNCGIQSDSCSTHKN